MQPRVPPAHDETWSHRRTIRWLVSVAGVFVMLLVAGNLAPETPEGQEMAARWSVPIFVLMVAFIVAIVAAIRSAWVTHRLRTRGLAAPAVDLAPPIRPTPRGAVGAAITPAPAEVGTPSLPPSGQAPPWSLQFYADELPWELVVADSAAATSTNSSPFGPARRPPRSARARRRVLAWSAVLVGSAALSAGMWFGESSDWTEQRTAAVLANIGIAGVVCGLIGIIKNAIRLVRGPGDLPGAQRRIALEQTGRDRIGETRLAAKREEARSRVGALDPAIGLETRLEGGGHIGVPLLWIVLATLVALGPWYYATGDVPEAGMPPVSARMIGWYAIVAIAAFVAIVRWIRACMVASQEGVLVRGLWSTRRLTWGQIARVTVRCGTTVSKNSVSPWAFPVLQCTDGDEVELGPEGIPRHGTTMVRDFARFYRNLRILDAYAEIHGIERSDAFDAWCTWAGVGARPETSVGASAALPSA